MPFKQALSKFPPHSKLRDEYLPTSLQNQIMIILTEVNRNRKIRFIIKGKADSTSFNTLPMNYYVNKAVSKNSFLLS